MQGSLALPAWEYDGFTRYFSAHPPAETTVPILLAQICALTFNANRTEKTPAREPLDFMPWAKPAPESEVPYEELPPEEQGQVMEAGREEIVAMFGIGDT